MTSRCLLRAVAITSLLGAFCLIGPQSSQAQVNPVGPGTYANKFLSVGQLQQYFQNTGIEIEYGLRGRGVYLNTDQLKGLTWPSQWLYQDHNVGKALWIGATNFKDPADPVPYQYKVLPLGRGAMYMSNGKYLDYPSAVTFPVSLRLISRLTFKHPSVTVDGADATNLTANDQVDEVDPSLPCDRMIYSVTNTPLGITMTRKVLNWAQQYNDNYFIYEWTFKNTGLTDNAGGKISPVDTLHGVMFNFIYRFADGNDAYFQGWAVAQENYGINTLNDCIGQDPAHTLPDPNNFRAIYEYFGPDASGHGVAEDIGGPCYPDRGTGTLLSGTGFTGEMVLHADNSATNKTDNLDQPSTTQFVDSDNLLMVPTPGQSTNRTQMAQEYQQMMTVGHPSQTHSERIGRDVNGWPTSTVDHWSAGAPFGTTSGGIESQQGFGPYTIPPGDSINIVLCEAIAGINHVFMREVAKNWREWYSNGETGTTPLPLPPHHPVRWPNATWAEGGTTTDGNVYKNAWVFTGEDSLFQTFRRARATYDNLVAGIDPPIPMAPPPPDVFKVSSGGDRIRLQWSTNAESAPNFDGYQIFRQVGRPDTEFVPLVTIDRADLDAKAPIDPVTSLRTYDDQGATRGFNYYYYIQTKDNGSTNTVAPGVPLVSSLFYTITNVPASLRRPAGHLTSAGTDYSLSAIRIVPNPYNVSANNIQYGTNNLVKNQLSFFNLPPQCKISIFTDVGQLVQTINHTNGSGDETWNSQTSSGQVVASGLYIAYFEVTADYTPPGASGPAYHKGDSIYKKFIIIR
jgi:hypothetical protein